MSPATTPDGVPYVLPSDHPLEFPTHSQQLAQFIDDTWDPPSGGLIQLQSSIPSNLTYSEVAYSTALPEQLWGGVTRVNGRLIVPKTGLWHIEAQGTFGTNAAGNVRSLNVNALSGGANGAPGGQAPIGGMSPPLPTGTTSGTGIMIAANGTWLLSAGEEIRLMACQDSGVSLTCIAALSVEWRRA